MLLRQALLNWVTASQLGRLWNMPMLIAPKHEPMDWIRASSVWLLWTCFGLSSQVSWSSKWLCVRTSNCWGICSYLDPPCDIICVCVCIRHCMPECVCACVCTANWHVVLSPDIALMRSPSSPLLEEWQLQKPFPNDYNWLIGESLTSSASFNNPNMALKWL